MKDYIAIIGATAAITSVAVFAGLSAWSGGINAGNQNSLEVPVKQVSVPLSSIPESNGQSLKESFEKELEQAKLKPKKPVITIEEIDPQDRKQSIKAKLEEAKAEAARKSEARKLALEKEGALEKGIADAKEKPATEKKDAANKKGYERKKSKKQIELEAKRKAILEKRAAESKAVMDRIRELQNPKKDANRVTEKNRNGQSDDSKDPGKIDFEKNPIPVAVPEKEELKIPAPMELINADARLLTKIANNTAGPSPAELHGTWEVMPCHSSVGVIAKRSFNTMELTQGSGAYFEIVQFYSDRKRKVFGPNSQTTIYVKLDQRHMLAAVNANTNRPKFSVLKKISSEVEKQEEPEEEKVSSALPGQRKTADVKRKLPSNTVKNPAKNVQGPAAKERSARKNPEPIRKPSEKKATPKTNQTIQASPGSKAISSGSSTRIRVSGR